MMEAVVEAAREGQRHTVDLAPLPNSKDEI